MRHQRSVATTSPLPASRRAFAWFALAVAAALFTAALASNSRRPAVFIASGRGEQEGVAEPLEVDEAIVVPGGGGQRDRSDCSSLPQWVRARLDRAAARFREGLDLGRRVKIITLSFGTPHRPPPRDDKGFPIAESASAACYLHTKHRVPWDAILRESTSLDTIGNAYFARTTIIDPLRIRRLRVITSAFHMRRTRLVFEWVLQVDNPASRYRRGDVVFEAVDDVGLDGAAADARRAKEAGAVRGLVEGVLKAIPAALPPEEFIGRLALFIGIQHSVYSAAAADVTRRRLAPVSAVDSY